MTGWAFLRSRRWAGYLALVILFAIVCCFLAEWQFARRAEAQAELAKIDGNYDSSPVALGDALPGLDSYDDAQKWTPVEMTGTYLSDELMLARNRPYDGHPGFEIIVPFRTTSGEVFIVDRGWVPTGNLQDTPDSIPAAPEGQVTVIARLKAGEPVLAGRTAIGNQLATINLDEISQRLGEPIYSAAYGLLVSEDPAVDEMPAAFIKPVRDEGPHLSYAIQWYIFALLAFGGLVYAARQEKRQNDEVAAGDDGDIQPRPAGEASAPRSRSAAPVKRASKRRVDTDTAYEDDLLDSRESESVS